MEKNDIFTIKIGGQAGQGIKMAGLTLAKVAVRSGYNIYTHTEFASLIRGGHNVMQINISAREVTAPSKKTDLLIALNQETIDLHGDELTKDAVLIFDEDHHLGNSKIKETVNVCKIPLSRLAKKAGGAEVVSNTVALGAVVALLSGKLELLQNLLAEELTGDIARVNMQAAREGYEFTLQNFPTVIIKETLKQRLEAEKIVINGNEAVALGAITGGLKFVSIYPMSPISGILTVLASLQEKYNFIYKQPEDEISAINMAIGAAFAGARAMTATSGGGFCLMTEGYGLAGMTETPLVIIEGMRGGPATGLPTWSEQGDLRFILHAHQGEFPRIILAAGDVREVFYLTAEAFNLADKYQTPVVVLTDKNICESDQSFEAFEIGSYNIDRGKLVEEKLSNYRRYAPEADGISHRALPGSGNFWVSNSDEHNSSGFSTEEIKDRVEQMNKRMAKLTTCAASDMPAPQLYGPEDADFTIVSWGSCKGSIIEALKSFNNVNYLHLTWMSPFPTSAVKTILTKAERIIGVEANYSGQLISLIREKTGIEITEKLLKYDGRPFYPEEIMDKIKGILKK